MEWVEIESKKDIKLFMELYGYFHDSCIKELRYDSGMFVTEKLSMNPINSKRNLYVLFQRQWEEPSTIEMLFEKIDCLSLTPSNENYDGIIFNAHMCFDNDKIVWFDSDVFTEEDDYKELYSAQDVTWIRASSVRYRIVENYLGENQVYINKEYW